MESKENNLLELFFNNPTREFHFEDILKEGKITRSKADRWLKTFCKENLIKRIKERKSMPYYITNFNSPEYKNRKKLFGLNKLYESGLLNHLSSLDKTKSVILFGSFSRSDWYKNSDVDIFIYGNPEGLKIVNYELKLKRDIQLFICQNRKELENLGQDLMKNIINGEIIKGDIDFVEVNISAKIHNSK